MTRNATETSWTTPTRASTAPSKTSTPTSAEVSISQGTLTITFFEKQRLMLTPQPSPRQLWVAFRDRAWHFNWDEAKACWMDDRGEGVELYGLIETTTKRGRQRHGAGVAALSGRARRSLPTRYGSQPR